MIFKRVLINVTLLCLMGGSILAMEGPEHNKKSQQAFQPLLQNHNDDAEKVQHLGRILQSVSHTIDGSSHQTVQTVSEKIESDIKTLNHLFGPENNMKANFREIDQKIDGPFHGENFSQRVEVIHNMLSSSHDGLYPATTKIGKLVDGQETGDKPIDTRISDLTKRLNPHTKNLKEAVTSIEEKIGELHSVHSLPKKVREVFTQEALKDVIQAKSVDDRSAAFNRLFRQESTHLGDKGGASLIIFRIGKESPEDLMSLLASIHSIVHEQYSGSLTK